MAEANGAGTPVSEDSDVRPSGAHLKKPRGIELPTFSDITIRYGNEGERVFYGHKIFLATASDWFKAAFEGQFTESNQKEITLHDDDPDALEILLRNAYNRNGILQLTSLPEDCVEKMITMMHVLVVADKYLFDTSEIIAALAQHSRDLLKKLETEIVVEPPHACFNKYTRAINAIYARGAFEDLQAVQKVQNNFVSAILDSFTGIIDMPMGNYHKFFFYIRVVNTMSRSRFVAAIYGPR